MSIHTITLHEQLAEVERMIGQDHGYNSARNEALKAIAADLRARLKGAPSAAATVLQKRLTAVKQSKTPLGYANGPMIGLAQELIGRWPVVKMALERFEAEVSV